MNRITFTDDYAAPFLDEMEDGPGEFSAAELAAFEMDRALTIMPVEPCPWCDQEIDEDGRCACRPGIGLVDLLEAVETTYPRETVPEWQARMRSGWTAAKH